MQKILFILFFIFFHTPNILMYEIMSYDEYSKIQHEVPYSFVISYDDQHLFYFGANHSCDPENNQYPKLEQFWNEFLAATSGENNIVLVEGSLRNVRDSKIEAITQAGGEGGFITFLASQKSIKRFCPEPTEQELYMKLLENFCKEDIDYLKFAQICLQFHRYKEIDSAINFEIFYQSYSKVINNFQDLNVMKKVHKDLFHNEFDITNERFFYNVVNPVDAYCNINNVARAASQIRDQYIVNCIEMFLKQGKNVFIVYGCTHAVMQENALKSVFTKVRYKK